MIRLCFMQIYALVTITLRELEPELELGLELELELELESTDSFAFGILPLLCPLVDAAPSSAVSESCARL